MTKYVCPVLGNQKIITQLGPRATPGSGLFSPGGKLYSWDFPWTTMTVVVKKNSLKGMAPTTTTGRGWDCADAMQGPRVQRGELVAGAIGLTRYDERFGDGLTVSMSSVQMILPEPGAALQLLAGVVGMLGIAAWRARRIR